MKLNEIDTTTEQGRFFMMALAALTVSPNIHINGKELDGRQMTPDQMLNEIEEVSNKVFKEDGI